MTKAVTNNNPLASLSFRKRIGNFMLLGELNDHLSKLSYGYSELETSTRKIAHKIGFTEDEINKILEEPIKECYSSIFIGELDNIKYDFSGKLQGINEERIIELGKKAGYTEDEIDAKVKDILKAKNETIYKVAVQRTSSGNFSEIETVKDVGRKLGLPEEKVQEDLTSAYKIAYIRLLSSSNAYWLFNITQAAQKAGISNEQFERDLSDAVEREKTESKHL